MSAHRDPEIVADYAQEREDARPARDHRRRRPVRRAAGRRRRAHELPVIGVPLTSSKSVAGGLDALLSIAQMPPGVPVACVGVDSARNAAVLAARILDA